ncbi:MAG: divalent-cation tolerance protein CutA [Thiobacillus sp.]|nr:divalent-cation tolerance protein CutA [Thiobacillus sp.]
MQTPSALIVFTTLPDPESARDLARKLVEARLAACVNVMSPCRSIYRWQGELNEDGEIPLFIKTSAENYDRLEAFVRENHPYELPELVAMNITRGLPGYLAWLAEETTEQP